MTACGELALRFEYRGAYARVSGDDRNTGFYIRTVQVRGNVFTICKERELTPIILDLWGHVQAGITCHFNNLCTGVRIDVLFEGKQRDRAVKCPRIYKEIADTLRDCKRNSAFARTGWAIYSDSTW